MVGPVARIEAGASRSAGRTNPTRVKRGKRRPSLFCVCVLSIALCRLEKQGVGLVHGRFVGEWKRLGAERTVAHVPGEFFRQAWQVTSHITHLIAPLPSPYTLPPSRVPHSHFFSALMINAKKNNLICSLTLIGRCIQSHPSFMSPVWSRSIYLQHVSLAFSFISPVWSRSIYLQLVDLAFFARPFRQLIFFVDRCDSFSIHLERGFNKLKLSIIFPWFITPLGQKWIRNSYWARLRNKSQIQ